MEDHSQIEQGEEDDLDTTVPGMVTVPFLPFILFYYHPNCLGTKRRCPMSWRSDQPMYLKARDRICNRTWNFTVDESHNASHAPTDFDNTIGANKTDSTVRMGKTETSFLLGNHTIT